MSNYIENYVKFKNKKDFETALTYVLPSGTINADLLVPMSNKIRDIVKEIMDGTDGWDNDDLNYYFEHYSIKDFWKKLYWGASVLYDADILHDKNAICFKTNWSAAIGVVKALHDLKLDFVYLYKNEGYNDYDYVEFKSITEVDDKILPNAGLIVNDDFLKGTYLEFLEYYGGEEELHNHL